MPRILLKAKSRKVEDVDLETEQIGFKEAYDRHLNKERAKKETEKSVSQSALDKMKQDRAKKAARRQAAEAEAIAVAASVSSKKDATHYSSDGELDQPSATPLCDGDSNSLFGDDDHVEQVEPLRTLEEEAESDDETDVSKEEDEDDFFIIVDGNGDIISSVELLN